MPGICASRGRKRLMISSLLGRWLRGFKRMNMTPVFVPDACPPREPTLDMNASTAGSVATMAAAAC